MPGTPSLGVCVDNSDTQDQGMKSSSLGTTAWARSAFQLPKEKGGQMSP